MGLACRGAYSRLLTRSSLRSPGGPGVRIRSLLLVGRLFNCRISALWCVRGYDCRQRWRIMVSLTHGTHGSFPFRPLNAWLVWCWPACVRSVYCRVVFLQQFGWSLDLSAALWSACASWGQLPCRPRRCSRMLSVLSSRLVLRFVVAGLSDLAVVLRPGRARRIVLFRRCRGRQWSARPGLCGGQYRPGRRRLVAVGCPHTSFVSRQACFVVVRPVAACRRARLLRCCQHHVWLAVVFAA